MIHFLFLVPAPPQKPVDLAFPLQVEHQFAALFALFLAYVP
jgi:hypothetical protein